ncbi:MAG: NUDIX domain-containing protein [Pseudomonadales bacterium]
MCESVHVVGCILVRSDQVLLGLRQNTGRRDGCWSLPGGRVEEGETPEESIVREMREELGIAVNPAQARTFDLTEDNGLTIRCFYFFDWSEPVRNCEPEFCAELKWWNRDSLPETTPSTQLMLDWLMSR